MHLACLNGLAFRRVRETRKKGRWELIFLMRESAVFIGLRRLFLFFFFEAWVRGAPQLLVDAIKEP